MLEIISVTVYRVIFSADNKSGAVHGYLVNAARVRSPAACCVANFMSRGPDTGDLYFGRMVTGSGLHRCSLASPVFHQKGLDGICGGVPVHNIHGINSVGT